MVFAGIIKAFVFTFCKNYNHNIIYVVVCSHLSVLRLFSNCKSTQQRQATNFISQIYIDTKYKSRVTIVCGFLKSNKFNFINNSNSK